MRPRRRPERLFAIGGLDRAISKRSLPDRCIEPLDLWMYIHDSCGERHKTSRKLSALMKRGEARIGAGQRSYTRLDHSDILGISLLVEAAEQVAAQNTVCEPGKNCGSRVSGPPGFRRYRKRQRFRVMSKINRRCKTRRSSADNETVLLFHRRVSRLKLS